MKITYLPVNSSISTTGHKLQGKKLDYLVVTSWAYNCPHWVYVVLSRVKKLDIASSIGYVTSNMKFGVDFCLKNNG